MAKRQDPRVRKMQKMRKAWAKPFSIRSVRTPNFQILKERYMDHKPVKERDNRLYIYDQTTAEYLKKGNEGDSRLATQKRRQEVLDQLADATDIADTIVRMSDDVWMCFNASYHVWYFEFRTAAYTKTSMRYGDKRKAIQAYAQRKIVWIKLERVPPPPVASG